jgi:hypothetical protein
MNSKTQNVPFMLLASAPGFWRNETSGVLKPAIEAYINGKALDVHQIAAMRAYLRQWIMAPAWDRGEPSPELEKLRSGVDGLTTQKAIHDWLWEALGIGIDPL